MKIMIQLQNMKLIKYFKLRLWRNAHKYIPQKGGEKLQQTVKIYYECTENTVSTNMHKLIINFIESKKKGKLKMRKTTYVLIMQME